MRFRLWPVYRLRVLREIDAGVMGAGLKYRLDRILTKSINGYSDYARFTYIINLKLMSVI